MTRGCFSPPTQMAPWGTSFGWAEFADPDHSLGPRLTNISYCHHTAQRRQGGGILVTKQGKPESMPCESELGRSLPLWFRSNSGGNLGFSEEPHEDIFRHSSRQLSPCIHPRSLVLLLSYTNSLFLRSDHWETGVKKLITHILKPPNFLFL